MLRNQPSMLVEKKRKYNWPLLSFFVTASLLLALSLLSSNRFQVQKNSSNWVTHTYEVKIKLQQVLNGIRDAESNARGYFLLRTPLSPGSILNQSLPYLYIFKNCIPLYLVKVEKRNILRAFAFLLTQELMN